MVVEFVVAAVEEPLSLSRDNGKSCRLENPEGEESRAEEERSDEAFFDDVLEGVEVAPRPLLEGVPLARIARRPAPTPSGPVGASSTMMRTRGTMVAPWVKRSW